MYVFLVYVVVPDGVERLGIQREALPVLFTQGGGALRASDHVSPERGRDQHRDQDENPRRRVPQLTSGLGSLPHAGNCIAARFGFASACQHAASLRSTAL